MSKLTKYKFSDLYEMSSGISSSKEQAGHGSPFISFSTVFNNYFLPEELPDLMDTSLKEQEIFSVKKDDVFITRTSETVDALAMSCVAVKDYPKATFSGFVKRLRPKTTGIVYSKYIAFFLRSKYFRKVLDCNTIMTLRATIVDYDGRESRANMQPSINSVWFAKMKNSIKHLYLNKEMQPIISSSILSTGFCGLQCNEISFEYIASYVSNAYFEIHKDMLAHGATQEAVNNDDLAGVHIIIPEDTVLRAYHETTQAIYAQISKNICENQELVKLRDWLLPMLMNGQATISD